MNLPDPVQTYFDAEAAQDGDALAAVFADQAIVQDEGQRHQGPVAIRDWWLAAKQKYRHRAVPQGVAAEGGKIVVTAQVTGDFPGSPAVLTFRFGLDGDRISDLAIG